MPRLAMFGTLLLALSSSATATDAAVGVPTFADAMRAYYAKDHATCASILVRLEDTSGPGASRIAYNAARCLALSGRTREAFKSLEQATDPDVVRAVDLDEDPDLASLRADAAWPAFRARIAQREQAHLDGIDQPLRNELLARNDRAEAARGVDAVEATRIDRDNAAWLKQLIANRGWPGTRLVLKDGARAAWRLALHADAEPGLQEQILALLDAAVATGDAEPAALATLTDHVLVANGKPQRYGTQFHVVDGKLVPHPIEDEANVDLLRAFAGLPSLTEYKKALREAAQTQDKSAP